MAVFPGGSAWAMVRDIAEGYLLLTERPLKQFAPPDLDKFQFEVDRRMRDIRSEQPSLEDIPAIQVKNRRVQRLQTALVILQAYRAKSRK